MKSPFDLAVCRILFFGIFFAVYFSYDIAGYATVSQVFWKPVWAFSVLHLPVLSERAIRLLQIVWKTSLLLSALGLFTGVSTTVAFFLGFYLIGLPFCFGYASHYAGLLIFILGILAVARCADTLSLDQLRSRKHFAPSLEYAWPLYAIWSLLALIFFAAGVAKLRLSGFNWVTTDFFAFTLLRANYPLARVANAPLTSWGLYLAQYPWLCHIIAGGTIVVELCYPLALVPGRQRFAIVALMVFMLVAVRILLGPPFEMFIVCHLFWVPWGKINSRRRFVPRAYSIPA